MCILVPFTLSPKTRAELAVAAAAAAAAEAEAMIEEAEAVEYRAELLARLEMTVAILTTIGTPNTLSQKELMRYQKYGPKVITHTGEWTFALSLVHPTANYYVMVTATNTGSAHNAPFMMEEWAHAYHYAGWGVEYITLEKAAPIIKATTASRGVSMWVTLVLMVLALLILVW